MLMTTYPLPLVWERICVVVVIGIWESEGTMISTFLEPYSLTLYTSGLVARQIPGERVEGRS